MRESVAAKKQRALRIAALLAQHYAGAECALTHRNAYELLVATILSAQCTDARVNLVTPDLFRRYPTTKFLANAQQEDIEELIHSTGFYRAKAANLIGMARGVENDFNGELPKTLDELITLPGVGRKTANVLLGTAYGIAVGVVVDTHVKRISYLLGLTKQSSPEQVETDLMALLPSSEWIDFSHRLIHHGRQICIARRPKCEVCPLLAECWRVGLPKLSASNPA